jgi:hypothetical protein
MRPKVRRTIMAVTLSVLVGCSGSVTGGDKPDAAGPSCSTDGTQALAIGKYTQRVAATSTTNVFILLSNCAWCADAIVDGASTALTSEGTWSSQKEADAGTGIRITKTNSQFFSVLSADGQSMRSFRISDGVYAGFAYAKDNQAAFTCDGR